MEPPKKQARIDPTNELEETADIDPAAEVWTRVFSFLGARDACQARLVCPKWNAIINASWRDRYLNTFPAMASVLPIFTQLYPFAAKIRANGATADKPAVQWDCPQCTLINQPDAQICAVCDGPKPVIPEPEVEELEQVDAATDAVDIDWRTLYQERAQNDGPIDGLDKLHLMWLYNEYTKKLYKVNLKSTSNVKRLRYHVQDLTGVPIELQKLEILNVRAYDLDNALGSFGEGVRRSLIKDTVAWGSSYGRFARFNSDPAKPQLARLDEAGLFTRCTIVFSILGAKPRELWKQHEGLPAEAFDLTAAEKEREEYTQHVARVRSKRYERIAASRLSQCGVFVKTLTGKTIWLRVTEDNTVEDIQELIQDTEGIPPDQQRLIFRSIEINGMPGASLADMGVVVGFAQTGATPSTLHLVLKLRGD